jgi:hypothetical protein
MAAAEWPAGERVGAGGATTILDFADGGDGQGAEAGD